MEVDTEIVSAQQNTVQRLNSEAEIATEKRSSAHQKWGLRTFVLIAGCWLTMKIFGVIPGALMITAIAAIQRVTCRLSFRARFLANMCAVFVIASFALGFQASREIYVPATEVEVEGEVELEKLAPYAIGSWTEYKSQKCSIFGRVRNKSSGPIVKLHITIEVIDTATADVIDEIKHSLVLSVPPRQARDFTAIGFSDFQLPRERLSFKMKGFTAFRASSLRSLFK
jgi:hypothetical protein